MAVKRYIEMLTIFHIQNFIKSFIFIVPFHFKVCMKLTDADQLQQQQLQPSAVYKPTGFKLIPSRGSAFQPLQPIALTAAISPATSTIITALPSSEDETN